MAENKKETTDDFAAKMNNHLMSSFVTLGIAYGDKLGLFELLSTYDAPRTVPEIAAAAKLKERYVQEWMSLMVVSDIIEADDEGTSYFLPVHRRTNLTSKGGLGNFGILAHAVPVFLKGYDDIIDASKESGPKGLSQGKVCQDFCPWMDRFTETLMSGILFTSIIPLVSGFKDDLGKGASVLSIGCGSGIDALMMGESFPKSTMYGIDIEGAAIDLANKKAGDKGLKNVNFDIQDAAKLPSDWSGKFDYVTSHLSIHDIGRPDLGIKEIFRVLKPGGSLMMIEFKVNNKINDMKGLPMVHFEYCASLLYCVPTSLAQEGGVGMGIGYGDENFSKLLKEAGFKNVEIKPVSGVPFYTALVGQK